MSALDSPLLPVLAARNIAERVRQRARLFRVARQQARAAVRAGDRERYEIVLRPSVTPSGLMRATARKEVVRSHPRRHSVEGHLRTLRSGRIVPVREHERGGRVGPGTAYDARRVAP